MKPGYEALAAAQRTYEEHLQQFQKLTDSLSTLAGKIPSLAVGEQCEGLLAFRLVGSDYRLRHEFVYREVSGWLSVVHSETKQPCDKDEKYKEVTAVEFDRNGNVRSVGQEAWPTDLRESDKVLICLIDGSKVRAG